MDKRTQELNIFVEVLYRFCLDLLTVNGYDNMTGLQ